MAETSFEIANRLNIGAIREVVKFEREERIKAGKLAQNAINQTQMLKAEVEQLRSMVVALLAANNGSAG